METYYKPEDLAKFADVSEFNADLAKKFFDYYGSVFAEGALTAREKSLIAPLSLNKKPGYNPGLIKRLS